MFDIRKKIHRKINSHILPKNKSDRIDWYNSIGIVLKFEYDDIIGEIEILDVKNQIVTINYNNKEYTLTRYDILNCRFGKITNKITKDFKIDIEYVFKDDKRDLTIINREYRQSKHNKNTKLKYYKYHCNKCGAELWCEESFLMNGGGCACCCNKVTIEGINDIPTTAPWMVKYFQGGRNEAKNYNIYNTNKLNFVCPYCGEIKQSKMEVRHLYYSNGFRCLKCYDGISYPEKFMYNLLKTLNIKIIYQYSKTDAEWCDGYRYDFYFKYNNEQYIVETHGEQHYAKTRGNWNRCLEKEKQNDLNKYNLAIKNGIKSENYIVIDCRYSNFDFIKNNILKSKLNDLFKLDNINWININEKSQKSLVKEVSDYWDKNQHNNSITKMSEIFNLSYNTIRKYLKIGTLNGWCNYNPITEKSKSSKRAKIGERSKIPIKVFLYNKLFGKYNSVVDFVNEYNSKNDYKINKGSVYSTIRGKQSNYKGFTFEYVNKETKTFKHKERIINPFEVYDSFGNYLGYYRTVKGMCENSESIFGIKLNMSCVQNVLNGKYSNHHGYIFKKITKEEYLKRIENDKNK